MHRVRKAKTRLQDKPTMQLLISSFWNPVFNRVAFRALKARWPGRSYGAKFQYVYVAPYPTHSYIWQETGPHSTGLRIEKRDHRGVGNYSIGLTMARVDRGSTQPPTYWRTRLSRKRTCARTPRNRAVNEEHLERYVCQNPLSKDAPSRRASGWKKLIARWGGKACRSTSTYDYKSYEHRYGRKYSLTFVRKCVLISYVLQPPPWQLEWLLYIIQHLTAPLKTLLVMPSILKLMVRWWCGS